MKAFQRLILLGGIIISVSIGFISTAAPTSVSAAPSHTDARCIDDDGHIRPDSLAPCLDPTPEQGVNGGDRDGKQDFAWVTDVWRWALSVVNVFAAFVLIVMAFANILYPWQALEQFRIRQLLPTFIWGIILANASLFICRAVVTAADLLMSGAGLQVKLDQLFINWGFDPGLLSLGTSAAVFGTGGTGGIGAILYELVISLIFVYLPIFGLIALSFVFYFRTALVLVLTAVSPLAFASIIFPPTRGFLTRWWDWFWKWTFGGVGSWLIIYLASLIQPTAAAKQGSWPTDILPYMLSLGLVYMAIMAPFKLGGAIGGMIEKLGKKGIGMGIGATKFVGGQAYKQAGLKATRDFGKATAASDKAQKLSDRVKRRYGEGSIQHLEAERRLGIAQRKANTASGIRDLVRMPQTLKEGFGARSALEEKQLKKGDLGSSMFESLAGREAALLARKDDYEGLEKSPDIAQQKSAMQSIAKKYGLSETDAYKLYTARPSERAKLSQKYGMSTDDTLKLQAATQGLLYNKRRGVSGKALENIKEALAGTPAGAAVGQMRSEFSPHGAGVTVGSQIDAAQRSLQQIGINPTPEHIQALQTGTRQQFAALHAAQGASAEQIRDAGKAFDDYRANVGKLSTRDLDVEQGIRMNSRWAVESGADSKQELQRHLQENSQKAEAALNNLAAGDGAVGADDLEVLQTHHAKFREKIAAGEIKVETKDDLRKALQEQVVGARSLIAQAESAAGKDLDAKLAANPVEVETHAKGVFKAALGSIKVEDLKAEDLPKITEGLEKMQNKVAKAQLAAKGGPETLKVAVDFIEEVRPDLKGTITDQASAQKAVDDIETGLGKVGRSVTEAYQESAGGGAVQKVVGTLKREYAGAAAAPSASASVADTISQAGTAQANQTSGLNLPFANPAFVPGRRPSPAPATPSAAPVDTTPPPPPRAPLVSPSPASTPPAAAPSAPSGRPIPPLDRWPAGVPRLDPQPTRRDPRDVPTLPPRPSTPAADNEEIELL